MGGRGIWEGTDRGILVDPDALCVRATMGDQVETVAKLGLEVGAGFQRARLTLAPVQRDAHGYATHGVVGSVQVLARVVGWDELVMAQHFILYIPLMSQKSHRSFLNRCIIATSTPSPT